MSSQNGDLECYSAVYSPGRGADARRLICLSCHDWIGERADKMSNKPTGLRVFAPRGGICTHPGMAKLARKITDMVARVNECGQLLLRIRKTYICGARTE